MQHVTMSSLRSLSVSPVNGKAANVQAAQVPSIVRKTATPNPRNVTAPEEDPAVPKTAVPVAPSSNVAAPHVVPAALPPPQASTDEEARVAARETKTACSTAPLPMVLEATAVYVSNLLPAAGTTRHIPLGEQQANTEEQYIHLDQQDVFLAQSMGLLRPGALVPRLATAAEVGLVYDKCENLATTTYESQKLLQKRWREFAKARGFALRVGCNSSNQSTREGNAKYVCKQLRGQQLHDLHANASGQLVPCPFFVNVYGKNGSWKVTKMQLCHNHVKFAGYKEAPYAEIDKLPSLNELRDRDTDYYELERLLEDQLFPTYAGSEKSITGKAITSFLKSKGHVIDVQVAGRLKHQILAKSEMNVVDSFQKLASYLESVALSNRGSHWAFDKLPDCGIRACFFPSACLSARKYCLHLTGLDGTHLKGEMNKRGVILTATTKDVDGHIIVFGFAIVPVENYEHWHWFLKQVATASNTHGGTSNDLFISDRQKGLLAAVEKVFPGSGHRFCLRHIIGNIATQSHALTPVEEGLVYEMARSDCENDWQLAWSQLAMSRPAAADYLKKIPKEHWVKYAIHSSFKTSTYDEVTSNLSESANNWIGTDCRSSYPLQAFQTYFLKVANQFHERRQLALKLRTPALCRNSKPPTSSSHTPSNDPLLPRWEKRLECLLQASTQCSIMPCLDGMYMVMFQDGKPSRNGYVHPWRAVNLIEKTCTCYNWHDLQFPCVHSVQAAVRHHMPLRDLFDYDKFTVSTFTRTYNFPFLPTPPSATLEVDKTLQVRTVVVGDVRVGKRGRCPGPKPKHKRKQAKAGSKASPFVANM